MSIRYRVVIFIIILIAIPTTLHIIASTILLNNHIQLCLQQSSGTAPDLTTYILKANLKTILIISFISLLIMIIIGRAFAQYLTKPILKATDFAEQISMGKTNIDIEEKLLKRNKETAILLKTLEKLAHILEESEKAIATVCWN